MTDIFTPWSLNRLTLPNRLVRSATWEGLADSGGIPSHDLINLTAELAEGGVGLIITGFTYIHAQGQAMPRQTGIHRDANIGPLTRVSDAVHQAGGRVAMQLVHAGGLANPELIGGRPLGPSAMVHPASQKEVGELSPDQIEEIIDAFAIAAARAKAAEFDAVELHGAHGYLISQFLCPITNQREDQYGGSLENRARFCCQAYQAVRDVVGRAFPVFIKLNSEDGVPGGVTREESLQVAVKLAEMGMDAIEVSGGTPWAGKQRPSRVVKSPEDEGYFLPAAAAIKQAADCGIIAVGGFKSPAVIERALDQVDAVAMCRPFINDPGLANRWKAGGRSPAECISCNKCFAVTAKQGLGCGPRLKEQ
jgi:2,4-dienoyl-CoA reductase-like NADH-dependent reductase (Old Yellow Enzyme family)